MHMKKKLLHILYKALHGTWRLDHFHIHHMNMLLPHHDAINQFVYCLHLNLKQPCSSLPTFYLSFKFARHKEACKCSEFYSYFPHTVILRSSTLSLTPSLVSVLFSAFFCCINAYHNLVQDNYVIMILLVLPPTGRHFNFTTVLRSVIKFSLFFRDQWYASPFI